MAFTLKQWMVRSTVIALQGEPENSVLADIDDTAEALAHEVMVEVCEEAGRDPNLAPLVTETVTIALTTGTGTIPTKMLVEFLPIATVNDPADATLSRKMRFLPWKDFIRPSISTLGYFSARNITSFSMTRPGTAYNPASGMTGNIEVIIPCAPDMPAAESTTITVARKIEELLVKRLAERLKGYVKMPEAA